MNSQIGKILCFLGFHKYEKLHKKTKICVRCKHRHTLIKTITFDDWFRICLNREITFEKYKAAMARGYIIKRDLMND